MPHSHQTPDHQDIPAVDPDVLVRQIADRFCAAMLEAALPNGLATGLAGNRPIVVILQVPGADWVDYFEEYLRKAYPRALVVARHDGSSRGLASWNSQTLMPFLHSRAVIGVSHNPESLLPGLLLETADHFVVLEKPDYPMVRDSIIDLTAAMPRRLKANDVAGLDAGQLLAALRPATSAGTMAKRISTIAARQQAALQIPDAPPIDALCLPPAVAGWAQSVVTNLPKGDIAGIEHALISGPPGTGKTLLARSLAASARLPMVSTNAANWLQSGKGHLSDVLSALADFFSELGRASPAIGVIDELDSVPNRMDLRGDYDPWWISLTNALLTAIDQLAASGKPVLLIGITNHRERLDPALIRAGRLGQHLTLPPPQSAGQRLKMLQLHLPDPLNADELSVLLPYLGHQTQAELGQIAGRAKARAAEVGASLNTDHLRSVLAPPETRPEELRRAVALHEAGHAVMAIHLGRPVHVVSIVPGEGHEGATDFDEAPGGFVTANVIEDNIRILLGGRAADMLAGCGANSGARADISRAAELIHDACFELFFYGPTRQWAGPGAEFKDRRRLVEERLGRLLEETLSILTPLRPALEAVAEALLARSVLTASDLVAVLGALDPSPDPGPEGPKGPRTAQDPSHP